MIELIEIILMGMIFVFSKFDQMSLDPNASKDELQRLEMQLSDKEEEIRELIARFNEVGTLGFSENTL